MNIYQGLLFLHGHLLRPEDVRPTADAPLTPEAASPSVSAQAESQPAAAGPGRPRPSRLRACFGMLENILFLGGRPMHGDRLSDVREPFEQTTRGGACV